MPVATLVTMAGRHHVALLGDSIFDNAAYTGGEPDVVTHLRTVLPGDWAATLCAVDGATTSALPDQLARVPADASHLVISIGGNDALRNSDLLSLRVTSSGQALNIFAERLHVFEQAYREVVTRALVLVRHTVVCTIYDGSLDPEYAATARIGLALFNDVILRSAVDLRVDVIELRSICTDPQDYANPIEPSGRGGLKIAGAIARAVGAVASPRPPAHVWGPCEGGAFAPFVKSLRALREKPSCPS